VRWDGGGGHARRCRADAGDGHPGALRARHRRWGADRELALRRRRRGWTPEQRRTAIIGGAAAVTAVGAFAVELRRGWASRSAPAWSVCWGHWPSACASCAAASNAYCNAVLKRELSPTSK